MTTQLREVLILDGKRTSISSCPPLPEDGRVIESNETSDNKTGIFLSSACWRQYVGTWEIKNNKFYLVALEGKFELSVSGPIFADWFTGILKITKANIAIQQMILGSNVSRELHIRIERGVVLERLYVKKIFA